MRFSYSFRFLPVFFSIGHQSHLFSHSEHVARLCQRVSLPARGSARPHKQAGAFDVIERHSARAPCVKSIFHVNDCAAPPLASHPGTPSERFQALNLGEWMVREAHSHKTNIYIYIKVTIKKDYCLVFPFNGPV